MLALERVEIRPVEVRVKRSNNRTISFLDCKQRQRRRERRMNVDEIVPSAAKSLPHFLAQSQAERDPGLRSVKVDRLAVAKPDYMRPFFSTFDPRSDDVDVMATASRLAREEMNVLADSTEVRIVVLGDQRDSERARKKRRRHRRVNRRRKSNLPREVVTAQRERHERRLGARSARGMESRRRSRVPYRDRA